MSKKPLHPFERSIGPGPYKFVGLGKIHISETHGARYIGPTVERGCGSCAHCGTGILNIFVIRAGDGKNYGVGCDCILKSNLPYTIITQAEKAERARKNKLAALRRDKKRALDIKEFRCLSWKLRRQCRKAPHPNKYFAEKGKTLRDYLKFTRFSVTGLLILKRLEKCGAV